MIKEMVKNRLICGQDYSGEYTTDCNIDFMLEDKINFSVLGKDYVIDRVKMTTAWSDALELYFCAGETMLEWISVPNYLYLEIYFLLDKEQSGGQLEGWALNDDLYDYFQEIYEKKDTTKCFGCQENMSKKCECMKAMIEHEDCCEEFTE